MTDITIKAIEGLERKKISYDIPIKVLEMTDELAKMVHCTRTLILDSTIVQGTRTQIEIMAKVWKEAIKDKKYQDKEKKEKIKKLIKDAENYKKKWDLMN